MAFQSTPNLTSAIRNFRLVHEIGESDLSRSFQKQNGTFKLIKADFDIAVVSQVTLALSHAHAQRANFS